MGIEEKIEKIKEWLGDVLIEVRRKQSTLEAIREVIEEEIGMSIEEYHKPKNEPSREEYKEFYGRYNEQMQRLIADGRRPLTMKEIIDLRIKGLYREKYFDTCDAIVYGEKGKFKIVKNCKKLLEINSQTRLKGGAIPITKKYYDSIKTREFTKDHSREEVWKELVRESYNDYVKLSEFVPMFYINNHESFCLRAWCVNGLDYRSDAGGRYDLDYYGRLLGIASKMQEKTKKYDKEVKKQ